MVVGSSPTGGGIYALCAKLEICEAPEGFEPSTLRLLGVRSNQLSYGAGRRRNRVHLSKRLSGRNRTSDPVIADIYSHMLYQLSYAELTQ